MLPCVVGAVCEVPSDDFHEVVQKELSRLVERGHHDGNVAPDGSARGRHEPRPLPPAGDYTAVASRSRPLRTDRTRSTSASFNPRIGARA